MTKKIIASLAILFTIVFFISSCKKDAVDKEPDQDLAQLAQGTYEVYYIKSEGVEANLPQNAVSATVYANRTDKNTVSLKVTLRNGSTGVSKDANFGSVQLKSENSATAMYLESEKLGTIKNNELEISGKDDQGQDLIIKAKK